MPATNAEIRDRFKYHEPNENQKARLDRMGAAINKLLDEFLETIPADSRDRALALTCLEDFRMKVNKAIIFS